MAMIDRQAVIKALRFGLERTLDEDLAYGLRMLVDMAIRALAESPFSDPTTAVQCIDRLHDGLRQPAVRDLDDSRIVDTSGASAPRCRRWTGTSLVLAFDEFRFAGDPLHRSPAASPQRSATS